MFTKTPKYKKKNSLKNVMHVNPCFLNLQIYWYHVGAKTCTQQELFYAQVK